MLFIGADHAGFNLKENLKKYLKKARIQFQDRGTFSTTSVDYPDIAAKVARLVQKSLKNRGVLICGSGVGMNIAANKIKGIRAVCCESPTCARLARWHNQVNILTLGARIISAKKARQILSVWLKTEASTAARHQRRIRKIHHLEGRWLRLSPRF